MWTGGLHVGRRLGSEGRQDSETPPSLSDVFFFFFLFDVRGAVSLGSTRDRDERGGRRKFDFNSLPLAY